MLCAVVIAVKRRRVRVDHSGRSDVRGRVAADYLPGAQRLHDLTEA